MKEKIEEEEVVKRSLSLSLVTLFRGRISEIDKPFNLNVADKFLFIL